MTYLKKVFFIVLLTVTTSLHAQDNAYILSYIAAYRQLALNEMQRTGVPACITLAQGILESQAGQSELAAKANNHFGIKCKLEWTGNVFFTDDDAKNECFRSYQNAEASYKDHGDFLMNRPNYAFLFELDPADYKAWCYGLKKAGYATSSTYAEKLIRIIEHYKLQEITITLPEIMPASEADIFVNKNDAKSEIAVNIVTNTDQEFEAKAEFVNIVVDYPAGVFKINHTKVVMVSAGTSLLSLAANYQLSYQQLLIFNELKGSPDILQADQLIFLERKPKMGASEFYTVKDGETLYDIAQAEGVRLESLQEYNGLSLASKLQPNQAIRLQPVGRKSLFSKK